MKYFAPNSVLDVFETYTAKNPAMSLVTDALQKKGFFSVEHVAPEQKPAVYDLVVEAQALLEQGIVNGLKTGEICAANAYIHTGGPANPLSHKNNKRTKILLDFLEAGGMIACVYNEKNKLGVNEICNNLKNRKERANYLRASIRYRKLLKEYPFLIDVPVQDPTHWLTTKGSGASYDVWEDLAGETKFFFSLNSFQVQTIGKSPVARQWSLCAGEIDVPATEPEITKRYEEVQEFINAPVHKVLSEKFRAAVSPYVRG